MTTSRRDFLRGLIAAAVAVQLVDLSPKEVDTFVDNATDQLLKIFVNGSQLQDITFKDVGNGWYYVTAGIPPGVDGMLAYAFNCNDGLGIFVGDEKHCVDYLSKNPHHIATNNLSIGNNGGTFSCYVKRAPSQLYSVSVESGQWPTS
jgi:hypothetical protein